MPSFTPSGLLRHLYIMLQSLLQAGHFSSLFCLLRSCNGEPSSPCCYVTLWAIWRKKKRFERELLQRTPWSYTQLYTINAKEELRLFIRSLKLLDLIKQNFHQSLISKPDGAIPVPVHRCKAWKVESRIIKQMKTKEIGFLAIHLLDSNRTPICDRVSCWKNEAIHLFHYVDRITAIYL